ncbi:MAG: hypothetical protein GX929_00320 [Clostridiales bacterium]|nr:hypothetical protein [Clostridiales bacterium]
MESVEQLLVSARLTSPKWRYLPALDPTLPQFSGIRALSYDGIDRDGKPTLTFAYIGFPKTEPSEKVPGIVLIHGGGGHSYLPWVKMWNDRGYAAIAPDTVGYFPQAPNAGSLETDTAPYARVMLPDGYADSPDNDHFSNTSAPLRDQWMTHAVAKTILANTLLRSFPCVDGGRVGLTGISWGGVISSIALTHDPRFAFAIPIYGSGYLNRALTNFANMLKDPENIRNFRAEDRFDRVRMPILWLAWNDDNNFTVTSNSLSYSATSPYNPRTALALTDNMNHSHVAGWTPAISMVYADWIVRGGKGVVTFATQPTPECAVCRVRIPAGVRVLSTRLFYIDAPMTYSAHSKYGYSDTLTFMDQVWQNVPARLENDRLSADIPDDAAGYYLEVTSDTDGKVCVTTSEWITRKAI